MSKKPCNLRKMWRGMPSVYDVRWWFDDQCCISAESDVNIVSHHWLPPSTSITLFLFRILNLSVDACIITSKLVTTIVVGGGLS